MDQKQFELIATAGAAVIATGYISFRLLQAKKMDRELDAVIEQINDIPNRFHLRRNTNI